MTCSATDCAVSTGRSCDPWRRQPPTGKLVLGEVLGQQGSDRPSPGQRIAVRQQKNIRALNVVTDPDDVVRRVPLTFRDDEKPVPSMALELAARALNAAPVVAEDGSVTLAGYRIPSAIPNTLTLNFEGGANDIPTYSFADLRACVSATTRIFSSANSPARSSSSGRCSVRKTGNSPRSALRPNSTDRTRRVAHCRR